MKISTHESVKTVKVIEMNDIDIIQLLTDTGRIPIGFTTDTVIFRVPTGGDYSGEDVEINNSNPVMVTIRKVVSKDS